MYVTHLVLADWRNYESLEVELAPGPTVLLGSNGQGKTNLVEALGYLATLGSHRVSSDQALIRAGRDSAVVRARLQNGDRSVLAEVQLNRTGANRAQVNRVAVRPRELPRYFSSVLFAPEDLALVRGEPAGRRRMLDELLVLRSPRMAAVLADYDRALRQRNSLLKSARSQGLREAQLGTLDVWDERLVAIGAQIIEARGRLVQELAPEVAAAYAQVAGAEHVVTLAAFMSIRSVNAGEPDCSDGPDDSPAVVRAALTAAEAAEEFARALTRARRAELDRGLTLSGPHRDDLLLMLNDMPARSHASHGESWSLALALKLAAARLLRRESSIGDPVLILDDVFAELDATRRDHLAEAVADFQQVLITAAVPADVPERLRGTTIRIRAGRLLDGDSVDGDSVDGGPAAESRGAGRR
ncbi:MAG: DNA replication/repair protein RecF [Microbacteriaceae bacterium]